jgi:hypothetical protein
MQKLIGVLLIFLSIDMFTNDRFIVYYSSQISLGIWKWPFSIFLMTYGLILIFNIINFKWSDKGY